MRYLLVVQEEKYQGLHGIEKCDIITGIIRTHSLAEDYAWDLYYDYLDNEIQEEDFEDSWYYETYSIKEDFKHLSIKELQEILDTEGKEIFIEEYCEA